MGARAVICRSRARSAHYAQKLLEQPRLSPISQPHTAAQCAGTTVGRRLRLRADCAPRRRQGTLKIVRSFRGRQRSLATATLDPVFPVRAMPMARRRARPEGGPASNFEERFRLFDGGRAVADRGGQAEGEQDTQHHGHAVALDGPEHHVPVSDTRC